MLVLNTLLRKITTVSYNFYMIQSKHRYQKLYEMDNCYVEHIFFGRKQVLFSPQYNTPNDEAIKSFYYSCILYFQKFNNKCSYNHCFKRLSLNQ